MSATRPVVSIAAQAAINRLAESVIRSLAEKIAQQKDYPISLSVEDIIKLLDVYYQGFVTDGHKVIQVSVIIFGTIPEFETVKTVDIIDQVLKKLQTEYDLDLSGEKIIRLPSRWAEDYRIATLPELKKMIDDYTEVYESLTASEKTAPWSKEPDPVPAQGVVPFPPDPDDYGGK